MATSYHGVVGIIVCRGFQIRVSLGFNSQSGRYVATVATVGGITTVLQGGKFGHGFVSAGLGAGARGIPGLQENGFGPTVGRTSVAAVVGGTSSKITGGKFANGAATAAFAAIVHDGVSAYFSPPAPVNVGCIGSASWATDCRITMEDVTPDTVQLKSSTSMELSGNKQPPRDPLPTVSERREHLFNLATSGDRQKFVEGLGQEIAGKIPGVPGKLMYLGVKSDIFRDIAHPSLSKGYDALIKAGPNGYDYLYQVIDKQIQYELNNGLVRPD